MNLRLLSLCAISALLPGALGAAPIAADSRITTVTVYGHGALVTRHAEVALTAGTQDVLFAGLPASLDPSLLQVSGNGTAQVTILDVTATPAQLESPAHARLKELHDQARAIQTELHAVELRGQILKGQYDYYESIKRASVAPQGGKDTPAAFPSSDVWDRLIAFYTDGITKVLTASQAADREKEELEARLEVIERQVEELNAPEAKAVTNVAVRLQVATAGTLAVKLAYTIDAASWRPAYDVRVSSADKAIRLDYGATVAQSSGEDWTGVALVLSTAQPNRDSTPPDLAPWYVEQEQVRTYEVAMPAPAAAMEARKRGMDFAVGNFEGADKLATLHAMQVAAASVEAGLNASSFAIPYPADIPTDNAAHKVTITSAPLAGEINHLAVPKLAELAYLRAAVTNTTEFPLIGGEIALFLDGNFVARSSIKTVAPTEKFVLNLGVDDAISVKRKLVNRLREDTGVLSRRVRTTYDVLITVQNNRTTAEKLVVKDQLPISKDEKIVVTLIAPPARDITQDEDGTIRWSLDLKPGEKRELPLKISIEHPADLSVAGLE
ncbi:MAG: mucoidy inhibitor MuiA family protein [Opitutaceae bacterium]|nr:mucoidy inhibitor MuiA family protein [Opitutaceae bacterium]